MQAQGGPRVVLYYSAACVECARVLDILRRLQGQVSAQLVDVAQLHPSQRQRLTGVPTLVLPDGRATVGVGCLEWLSQFKAPLQTLDSTALGDSLGGSLGWSTVSWTAAGVHGGHTSSYAPALP